MVQTLEAIKGGGGSIRIGSTGTISSLMTRELESVKSSPSQTPQTSAVSVACGATSAKRLQQRKSLGEASTSSSSNTASRRTPEGVRKTKSHTRSTHRIPILGSDKNMLDRTPTRQKTNKKGPNLVEIVDIKCRQPDRAWANPITNKLRKFGFSKLSESVI